MNLYGFSAKAGLQKRLDRPGILESNWNWMFDTFFVGFVCLFFSSAASCNEINVCHPQAQCVHSADGQSHQCRCNAGFVGDGVLCR